jgi:hypothetical protein
MAQVGAPIKLPLASASKHDISRPLSQIASNLLLEESGGAKAIHVVKTIPRPPKRLRPEFALPFGGVQTDAAGILDVDLMAPL